MPRNKNGAHFDQWFIFPLNYDPTWGPNECAMRAEEADPEKMAKKNPMADLVSIMGKRAFR